MNRKPSLMLTGIVMGVLMMSAPVSAWLLTPEKFLAEVEAKIDLEAAIPKQIGEWRSVEHAVSIVPTAEQEKTLNATYSQIVNRTYVNGKGDAVMLSIGYGSTQTRELRAHRQEVCYAAQGFKVRDLKKDNLRVGGVDVPVTRMLATLGSRSEPVTYWFTMGDELVRSYFEREFVQLKYALSGYLPDGYLVRVSSVKPDASEAYADQDAFVEALIAGIDKRLSAKLLGRGQ